MFNTLEGLLAKAEAHASASALDESVVLNWALAPDMFPFLKQIQVATELPLRALSRMADSELPTFDDDETTFEALRGRIEKARKAIRALPAAAIDWEPDATITFPIGADEMTLPRRAYLQNFILPNLYFHVTTAYAILRANGVELGKRDFIAAPGRGGDA